MLTLREVVVTRLVEAIGEGKIRHLSADAIYDADSADSPAEVKRIFLVLRWGEEERGIGPVNRRPLTLFGFGPLGDTNPVDAMVVDAAKVLTDTPQMPIEGGWITQIHTDRLKRGADGFAGGFGASVVPHRLIAVASGR